MSLYRESQPKDPKRLFEESGMALARKLETSLGVQGATILMPEDIARIGQAVFSTTPVVDPIKGRLASLTDAQRNRTYVHRIVENYDSIYRLDLGIVNRRDFRELYLHLMGERGYKTGALAQALGRAPEEKLVALRPEFAQLLAKMLLIDPCSPLPHEPDIRLKLPPLELRNLTTLPGTSICAIEGLGISYPLSTPPEIVIELNPSISTHHKITGEAAKLPRGIFVGRDSFSNEFIKTYAELRGLLVGRETDGSVQVAVRDDLYKMINYEFFSNGGVPGSRRLMMADLAIVNPPFSSDYMDLMYQLGNLSQTLKTGGHMVLTCLDSLPDQLPARDIIHIATDIFRVPPVMKRKFDVYDQNGEKNTQYLYIYENKPWEEQIMTSPFLSDEVVEQM